MKYALFLIILWLPSYLLGQEKPKAKKTCCQLPKKISSKDYEPNVLIIKFKHMGTLITEYGRSQTKIITL